jgi:hypothetical protein
MCMMEFYVRTLYICLSAASVKLPVARRNTRACDVQCSVVYACSKLGACMARVVYILHFVALHMGLYCVLEPSVARYRTVRFAYIVMARLYVMVYIVIASIVIAYINCILLVKHFLLLNSRVGLTPAGEYLSKRLANLLLHPDTCTYFIYGFFLRTSVLGV